MLVIADPIRVEIPHSDGDWFEFIKPSWLRLKKAKKAVQREGFDDMKAIGPEMMDALLAAADKGGKKAVEQVLEAERYALSSFDMGVLLRSCVRAWSFSGADGKPADVNDENVNELDEQTATFMAQTIIDSVKPLDEEQEGEG